MRFIRSLDFFTKAKEEIETATGIGGLFSIAALGVIGFHIKSNSPSWQFCSSS
jgi:hypothetical protein